VELPNQGMIIAWHCRQQQPPTPDAILNRERQVQRPNRVAIGREVSVQCHVACRVTKRPPAGRFLRGSSVQALGHPGVRSTRWTDWWWHSAGSYWVSLDGAWGSSSSWPFLEWRAIRTERRGTNKNAWTPIRMWRSRIPATVEQRRPGRPALGRLTTATARGRKGDRFCREFLQGGEPRGGVRRSLGAETHDGFPQPVCVCDRLDDRTRARLWTLFDTPPARQFARRPRFAG